MILSNLFSGGFVTLDGRDEEPWIASYVNRKFKNTAQSRGFETPRGLQGTRISLSNFSRFSKGRTMIFTVHLPFETRLHLFAVSADAHVLLDKNKVEPIVLEGNYQAYFQLFALKGQQVDARYMLDPVAMEATMTYMHQYTWEVWGNTLYVISEIEFPSLDVFDAVVEEIRPAITSNASVFPVENPVAYRVLEDSKLSVGCTFCGDSMLQSANGYACRHGHGFVLSDRQLRFMDRALAGHFDAATIKEQFKDPYDVTTPDDLFDTPILPWSSCWFCLSNSFQAARLESGVDYQACPSCQYNWIPAATKHLAKPVGF